MLARFKKGFIFLPGGDKIGRRRLDTHFTGLSKLGAKFSYQPEVGHTALRHLSLKAPTCYSMKLP